MGCRPDTTILTNDELDQEVDRAISIHIEKEREKEAGELREWLQLILEGPETATSEAERLCGLIRSMGEVEFLELMKRYIGRSEARLLLGWWERHSNFDRGEGR